MKQIFTVLFSVALCALVYACSDRTYARELKAEEKLIKEYIQRENINVLKNFPAENNWKPNDYVELEKGMYFHLEKPGIAGDSIKAGNLAIVRYKSYTLSQPTDSVDMWNTTGAITPPSFVWGTTSVCEAWLTALSLMQRQFSEGKIIAPSKTGFNSSTAVSSWGVSDDETSVTPRLYHLQLRFSN
ncbi:hypothetical protein FACS189429_6100 [Bacteroidia bacterium]|nr:hypothetical protein FACS189429_6100 [Bacteroidia bacterium]